MSVRRIISYLVVYIWKCIAAGVSGAAASFLATVGASAVGVEAFTTGQLATVTVSGGLIAVAGFLVKSPLPSLRVGADGDIDIEVDTTVVVTNVTKKTE